MKIWKIEIWKNGTQEKSKFRNMQIWKNANLENFDY